MMDEGLAWAIPRRVRIRPGEEDAVRAQWADMLWNDPEAAKRAALEARAQYWLRRAESIEGAIARLEAEGRRDRCSYAGEMRPLLENLAAVRARLEELAVEAARFGVKLPCPASQPTTGSGRPRRKRRRVTGGLPRRRRVAAAAAG
jgi:hypothetical protein